MLYTKLKIAIFILTLLSFGSAVFLLDSLYAFLIKTQYIGKIDYINTNRYGFGYGVSFNSNYGKKHFFTHSIFHYNELKNGTSVVIKKAIITYYIARLLTDNIVQNIICTIVSVSLSILMIILKKKIEHNYDIY